MKHGKDKLDGNAGADGSARFVAATPVTTRDGVGRALASAFPAADHGAIPADMLKLLQKIDEPRIS